MKKMYFMLLLALAGLGSSCTNEDDSQGQTTTGTAGEIQLIFSGSGESEEYTKAIASESENKIGKLKVYLFAAAAADAADTDWHYLETWTMTEATPGTGTKEFNLQSSGSSWKASIKPGELKGLPYLTLVCVANQDEVQDEAETAITLTPVTTDAGTGVIGDAGTLLSAFKEAYTTKLTNASDPLITPLVMTGTGTTKISGSVSKVTINLKRIVARFDIDNTTATSNLTINSIAFGDGRPNGSLFGKELAELAEGDRATKLITYKDRDFKGENANQGTLESALYVYPTHKTDKSYLIIKGSYKSPSTGQGVDVTYNIPIVKTPENANPGDAANYIPVVSNSRYKLHITDVTESNIFATFEIEDWTSGGGVIIKPDNDTPIFDALNGFSIADGGAADDLPIAITNADGVASTTEFKVVDNKSFKVTIAATGRVRAEKNAITKAETAADAWLIINDPTYEEKDGVCYTTFVFSSKDATGQQPVAVTFINEAASYDPDLWTTLTFYGPLAAPKLSDGGDGSLGNSVNYTTEPTAPTATMYKVKDSYILVKAMCIEGTKVVVPTGFAEAETIETNGYETIYKIKISEVNSLGSDPISIQNAEDENVKTDIAVTLVDAKIAAPTLEEATGIAEITGDASPYTVKTDIDELGANSYTLKITSPQGVEVTLPTGKWLDVTEKTAFSADKGYTEYTVKKSASVTDYTDFNIEFTNKLDATEKLTVTMNKAKSRPKLATATEETASDFNGAVTITDDYTATVDMYKAKDSKIYIKMTCDEAAAFATVDGLSITSKENNNYEISVTDVSKFTDPTTAVTAQNSSETTRTAILTITWLDPAIDFSITKDANSATTKSGDAIDVTYATLDGGNFEITVTGPIGSTISYDAISTTSWLGVNINKKPTTLADTGDGKTGSATIGLNDNGGVTTDPVVITITNKIDSDDTYKTKTITINKK